MDHNGRPGDVRGFLHKRFIGAVKGFVSSGFDPLGAVRGFVKTPPRRQVSRERTARPSESGQAGKAFGRQLKFGGEAAQPAVLLPRGGPRARSLPLVQPSRPCPTGTVRDPMGRGFCVAPGSPTGERAGVPAPSAPVGDAVMGQYGAALQPGVMNIERSVCLRGMQLGNDGLCYNRGHLRNTQRMWPRGRRPLLTGGEVRAVAIAARVGTRVDKMATRLRGMGLMKRLPTPKKAATGKTVVVHDAHHTTST